MDNAARGQEVLWNAEYIKVLLVNFMIFFSFMLLTPLLPVYLYEEFHADKDTIGMVLFGYSILALLARPFSGFLADSFPRKQVVLVSLVVFTFFFVGYLAAGTLLLFAVVRTLHGAPFGAVTVSNTTLAIDVLPSSRRTEGIGFYGLSNNIASAISPSVAIWIYHATHNFQLLFWIAMLTSVAGLLIAATIKVPRRELVKGKQTISLDRFFLTRGWSAAITMVCFSFSYGVVTTYLAIYGKDRLGIDGGAGLFFLLLSLGLILSRLVGNRSLRQGHISQSAAVGVCISAVGYLLFAAVPHEVGYYGAALIVGLGNGRMYPAYQNMFVNMAEHSQRGTANSSILVAWDVGVGLGILLGGVVAEHFGYTPAFFVAWGVNVAGALGFFIHTRRDFERKRLR
ncbi:MAG: MFS transporter [Bacteroidales bacterium]|nr:MFS transporter [Bacteroidales bacterium]